ncbi:acyl-CoA thioesterase [Arthrobacter sulfonylureivorans]|uniref:Acyl-CoA thioesterase n=1 Tax=Arthrobacter sulfonylureivorans TaxID=2486855 RepID=A0ABY3W528_9MICC|nr:acyl-CoA thioesterase [Arthrobacter sulfonylureivorans]UNK45295.1 acyl-CoA thioesterase [Arthrobacter sulfonylureivorans]
MTKTPSAQRLSCNVPMRWGDMDAYGHINNVEILRILEEARIHAFGPPAGTGGPGLEVDLPVFSDLPESTQALVAEHRVKYVRPLNYRNIPAHVEVWISAIKGASLTIAYMIMDPVTAEQCVLAETTLAFFHTDSGRLLRLSGRQRQILEPYLGEPNFR